MVKGFYFNDKNGKDSREGIYLDRVLYGNFNFGLLNIGYDPKKLEMYSLKFMEGGITNLLGMDSEFITEANVPEDLVKKFIDSCMMEINYKSIYNIGFEIYDKIEGQVNFDRYDDEGDIGEDDPLSLGDEDDYPF